MNAITKATQIASNTAIIGNHTSSAASGAYGAGLAEWVFSVTGSYPQIIKKPGGTVELILTPLQHEAMSKFFNSSIKKSFSKSDKPQPVKMDLGPSIRPVAIRYLVPTAAALFVAGWIVGSYLK